MAKKINEIHRTATFAWGPGQQSPIIAAGTVSGALDDSFSNASELELFTLDLAHSQGVQSLASAGKVSTNARFNTLAWGHMTAEKPSGIIVGGMESGELELWDPSAILNNQSADACLISRSSTHTGTIRGLDFNPIQTNLLASVGSNNEVYIWDLSTPNKPHNPGAARSNKLDDITSVGWNNQVAHILATSSTTGYTVVWDLRSRKEVMSLSYTGQHAGNVGRRGTSAVAWHPDAATQLVAASEDDNNPIITLWDLRHAHSPEKTLSGHQKGITGVSWCQQDADLLMSCSKDCRTLCWNPRSGELLGELSQSSNWTFQAEWCPRNPDLLASASFDGKITVCSLQGSSNNESAAEVSKQQPISNDPFDTVTAGNVQTPSFALTQPPKWLRKPVGASFGFGGKLVVFNNKAGQASQQAMANLPAGSAPTHQVIPRTLAIQSIVTDPEIVQRSNALEEALNHQTVTQLIDERHSHSVEKQEVDDKEAWEVLRTLFAEDAREQLMKHLGFDKSQAAAALAAVTANKTLETPETVESVSEGASPKEVEETPAITQDKATEESQQTNEEKTDKLSGLFQISDVTTPEEEFFAKAEQTPLQAPVAIPSAIIPAIQREALKLYPADVSETDTLITRSIVLGDFESAVQLCLDSDRLSDALLLAICSGGDLLAHTQKVYFERQAKKTSYLRLLESIMSEDLSSVVETVTLDEWTSVVAVLCTFAQTEQFGVLCETLGDRLQQAWDRETAEENSEKKQAYRRHATLCYLASGNLQKVAAIWITEQEEENSKSVETGLSSSLQKLIEKVTVFRQAIAYEDKALEQTSEETSSNDYPLARLYNKYCEYAELLATQGKLSTAQKYIDLTPTGYQKSLSDRLPVIRDRVYRAYAEKGSAAYTQTVFPFTSQHLASGNEGQSADTLAAQGHEQQAQLMSSFGTHVPSATAAVPATMTTQYTTPSYAPSAGSYAPSSSTYGQATPSAYAPTSTYTQATPSAYAPPAGTYGQATPSAYTPTSTYTQPAPSAYAPPPTGAYGQPANTYNRPISSNYSQGSSFLNYSSAQPTVPLPPPPMGVTSPKAASSGKSSAPPKPAGAWNDPPMMAATSAARNAKPVQAGAQRVVSPFPNAPPASALMAAPPQQHFAQQNVSAPPAQGASALPPPPKGAAAPAPLSRQPQRPAGQFAPSAGVRVTPPPPTTLGQHMMYQQQQQPQPPMQPQQHQPPPMQPQQHQPPPMQPQQHQPHPMQPQQHQPHPMQPQQHQPPPIQPQQHQPPPIQPQQYQHQQHQHQQPPMRNGQPTAGYPPQ